MSNGLSATDIALVAQAKRMGEKDAHCFLLSKGTVRVTDYEPYKEEHFMNQNLRVCMNNAYRNAALNVCVMELRKRLLEQGENIDV